MAQECVKISALFTLLLLQGLYFHYFYLFISNRIPKKLTVVTSGRQFSPTIVEFKLTCKKKYSDVS